MDRHTPRQGSPDKQEHVCFWELCAYSGMMLMAGSFFIPGYQTYLWLRDGAWIPLSTKVLFLRILPTSFYVWLADDTSWVGLKKMISSLVSDASLFGFVFLLGVALFLFVPYLHLLIVSEGETEPNRAGAEKLSRRQSLLSRELKRAERKSRSSSDEP